MTGLLELLHGSLGELVMFCQCEDQEREDRAGDQGGDQTRDTSSPTQAGSGLSHSSSDNI